MRDSAGASTPLVSVLMGVYNGEAFLRESITSLLEQSFSDFELIIVDDCSTDSTPTILSGFDDPRIRVVRNDTNLGLTRSLNRALEAARGVLIARQDADDVSQSDRLAMQVQFFEDHADIGLLGTAYHVIDTHGERLASHAHPADDALLRWQMLFHNAFCHSSVMLRRELVLEEGLYDAAFRYSQDYDAWSRLLRYTKGANLSAHLVSRRQHGKAISTLNSVGQRSAADEVSRRNILQTYPSAVDGAELLPQMRILFSRASAGLTHPRATEQFQLYLCILAAYISTHELSRDVARALWRRELRRFRSVVKLDGLPMAQRLILWVRAWHLERAGPTSMTP